MENEKKRESCDHIYLEKLEFKPELRKSFLNFFITNFRVVILLIIMICSWGIYSFVKLPLESMPEVKIPYALVITSYPGASPADIEELVTKKLESGIAGLKDIKKITSSSANSISTISVEFDAKADVDESIKKLRDEINSSAGELPDDAQEPIVKEVSYDDSPIFVASLSGPYDGITLRKYAEDIQAELEKISGIREVNVSGGDTIEFEVAYDPQKLSLYNLSPNTANSVIQGTNIVIPGGTFKGNEFSYPIRTDARFYTAEKLGNIPLYHTNDGGLIYLKDVAFVKEKAIEKTVYSYFSSDAEKSQNSVTISVVKKTGGSIVDSADEAKSTINEMLKKMPVDLKFGITVDTSNQILKDYNQLKHDFFLTIILVFIVLLAIIGLKEAFVAGMAVPLVFFITFGVMDIAGITLNFLSMFSLILALGLLVDDAIVVVSATKQYLKTGKFTPEEAVLLVLNDFKVVLTTTTLTTVWAFLPLLLATGIMGQFMKSIPITVSTTLLASLLIALVVNHPLAAILERIRLTKKSFFALITIMEIGAIALILLKNVYTISFALILLISVYYMVKWYKNKGKIKLENNSFLVEKEWRDDELIKKKLRDQANHEDASLKDRLLHGIVRFDKLLPIYEKYLNKVLANKKTRLKTIGFALTIFALSCLLPITGIVPQELFPLSDSDYIYVRVSAPVGTNLEVTNKIVKQIEEKLLKYKEIKNFSTIVGTSGSNSTGLSFSISAPSHKAETTIRLIDSTERKIRSYELSEIFREDFKDIKGAEITIETPAIGPPSGSDFEARISGDDLQQLDKIANDLKPILTSIKGVVDVDISLKESPADYTFTLDPARLELYNLNAAYVGSVLRMAISGTEVTTILINGDEVKVMAKFAKDKIPNLSSLQNLQIINTKMQPVFIKDVAKVELKPSVEKISRIDQKRTVLLSSSVNKENRPNSVVSEFKNKVADQYTLPEGYEIAYGGQNETNNESITSVLRAMIVAIILIISTLIIQFNSFKKAMIVIMTIPLALIGVFCGLALTGLTLSFPGLVGVVALFGIVVKNAIILVDKINLNIKSGICFKDAIVDAGKSRLEAIVITSVCTIIGIIPITLSNETWMSLGGAIIFGLMLSSFLTLFIIPALYMTFIKEDERL